MHLLLNFSTLFSVAYMNAESSIESYRFLSYWNLSRVHMFIELGNFKNFILDYSEVEERALIFSCENSKIKTRCWTTINRKMLDPTKKRYPTSKGKGNKHPSKMVGGVKLCLESSPIPARDTQRAQTNFVRTRTQRPHRDWDRTVFEYLLWRFGLSVACCRGSSSGCSRPGCGISPLGGGRH